MSTAIGDPMRDRYAADPSAAVVPGTNVALLTVSRRWTAMGTGDMRAPIDRAGSAVANAYPSRVGNTLRWPDGHVTNLEGDPT